ncbi:MAG TPA: hypothetical protein VF420_13370 [Casimicrobiaceae bacterium]
MTKTEAMEKLQRLRSRTREIAKRGARLGLNSITTAAGGVAAGFFDVKYPYLPGTQVPTSMALGVALLGAAAADMFDSENNERVGAFASGLLAVVAARQTSHMLIEAQQKKTGTKIPAAA